jgi:hypothetical protein
MHYFLMNKIIIDIFVQMHCLHDTIVRHDYAIVMYIINPSKASPASTELIITIASE